MDRKWPPLSAADRRRLLFSSNLVVIGLVTVLATLRILLTGTDVFPYPALFVVAVCAANLFYLWRGGSTDRASAIFIALLLIGVLLGGLNNYGLDGPVVQLAPLIPIFTLLLLNLRAAGMSLALALVALIVLFVLDVRGLIPDNPNPPDIVALGRLSTMLTLCVVAAWGIWMFARYSEKLLLEIERQSTTDFLTNVLNRRGIEAILSHEIARARRNNSWLSVLMIDVDLFKLYNDSNGHQMGDQCLVDIVRMIESCTSRYTDLVGRYGGEEFIVILPDTGPEGGRKVAGLIRREMNDRAIPYGPDNPETVTVTVGAASGRGEELKAVDQMIGHADAALYRGKERGRNCVVSCRLTADGAVDMTGDEPESTPGSRQGRYQ